MKILIIEDSQRISRALNIGLSKLGFCVEFAADGESGLEYARTNSFDVIVLDIMLPKMDGLAVLAKLREHAINASVLILSAKDQVEDRVNGLECGADDYLVKPFSFDELVARIKTLARRRHDIKTPRICIGDLIIDTAKRKAYIASNDAIELTASEYRLLEALSLQRGRVLSKDQLHDCCYTTDAYVSSNVIEVLISSLRRKLVSAGCKSLITTRRGLGYLIE